MTIQCTNGLKKVILIQDSFMELLMPNVEWNELLRCLDQTLCFRLLEYINLFTFVKKWTNQIWIVCIMQHKTNESFHKKNIESLIVIDFDSSRYNGTRQLTDLETRLKVIDIPFTIIRRHKNGFENKRLKSLIFWS